MLVVKIWNKMLRRKLKALSPDYHPQIGIQWPYLEHGRKYTFLTLKKMVLLILHLLRKLVLLVFLFSLSKTGKSICLIY